MNNTPPPAGGNLGNSALATQRAGLALVEWVQDRLTERDWQIVTAVNQCKVISGEQLERLFFFSLISPRSRVVSRGRTLRRLVAWRVLTSLERRIGGAGRGSSGAVFALDSVGQRLVASRQRTGGQPTRVRRPGAPTDRTLKHALAVTELFVRAVEVGRLHSFTVAEFACEPGCWWPDGLGGFIKPDAYLRLEMGGVVDHWWIEHDQATESLPTIHVKLSAYLTFVGRGQLGPHNVVPRVLLSTISTPRREALEGLVSRLPPPADKLFAVVASNEAAPFLATILND